MYAEITAAVQSTKALYELIKATQGLSNHNEIVMAVADVQNKLIGAQQSALESQEKQAELAEQVRQLKSQIADVESWETQIQRYVLVEFPTKAVAYVLKQDMREKDEPLHYLCTACVEKKQKSILQPKTNSFLFCPACKTEIQHQFSEDEPIEVIDSFIP